MDACMVMGPGVLSFTFVWSSVRSSRQTDIVRGRKKKAKYRCRSKIRNNIGNDCGELHWRWRIIL